MPVNLNFSFNFGVILLFILISLLLTGFLSVIFYSNIIEYWFFNLISNSFNSFNYFFLRVLHNTFANLFFFFIYLHILKSWFYSSKNTFSVLLIGAIIFLLSCAIAFFGYCLPMGQMSFWAAIVIFSLLSVLPFGDTIILYLFGGFSISSRTITFLFLLHFLFPLLLTVFVIWHLYFLHSCLWSSSSDNLDLVFFFNYYLIIDIFIVFFFLFFTLVIVFFFSFLLFEWVNFWAFNSLVTPLHIYPDWFLLFPYACLRSIDSKVIGVLLLVFIIFCLFIIPILTSYFNILPLNSYNYFLLFFFILLTFFGANPSVYPYNVLVIFFQIVLYLIFFLICIYMFIFYKCYL